MNAPLVRRSLVAPRKASSLVDTIPANLVSVQAARADDPRLQQYEFFRAKIRIDRNRLELAIEEQAEIYRDIGEIYSVACSLRDQKRDALARRDAEIARAERQRCNLAKEKETKDSINDHVMLHADHIALSDVYEQLKREADQWGALKGAFDQRMRMLRELVSLYTTGYWTTSGSGRAAQENRDAVADRVKAQLQDQRDQRRRSDAG